VKWLKPDEAALALGVSYTNLQVIAHRYQWKTIRNGKECLYSLKSIEQYLEKRAVK